MEDKKKRNKRIADWQKERRIIVLAKSKEHKAEIQAAADQVGESLNGYIVKAIQQRIERELAQPGDIMEHMEEDG